MGVFDAEPLSDNGGCFACGKNNPHGLGMVVEYEGDEAVCRITLTHDYQGWPGVAHGGIVATMLDEIMAHALIHTASHGVTTGMEISYKAPVQLGRALEIRGNVADLRSRLATVEARIIDVAEVRVLALGKATFLLRKGKPEKQ